MLNISEKSIAAHVKRKQYKSLDLFDHLKSRRKRNRLIIILALMGISVLLLPWTQNIRAKGYVTSLQPEQRPQSIPSLISGRIEKWYVQEGDFVQKGDTIVQISEIKDDYFDPDLLSRTQEQIEAKESSVL